MSLLDDVSIVVTPNGYKAGELYAVIPVPTEGAEEVTNGDFSNGSTDWNLGLGWNVASERLNIDTNDGDDSVTQTGVLVVGKRYKMTLTSNVTGTIKFESGEGTDFLITDGDTSVVHDFIADKTQLKFRRYSAPTTGYLDNISVKEYTSADMDFTRATAATRVDENGLVNYAEVLGGEEVIDGSFPYPNTVWGGDASTVFTEGSATLTGVGVFKNLLTQTTVLESGKLYEVAYTCDLSGVTSGSLKLQDFSDSSALRTVLDGTNTVQLTANGTTLKISEGGMNGTAILTNVSVKEVTRDNVPRIDYTGGGCPHILAEPQRTNLITYSEDFTDSSWSSDPTNAHITRVANAATSPSGENNATKLIGNNTTRNPSNAYIFATTSSGTPFVSSVFAKKGEYDYLIMTVGSYTSGAWSSFNLDNGTIHTQPTQADTTASIEDYGNGWYRCTIMNTVSSSAICVLTPCVDGNLTTQYTNTTNGIYVYGAQLENGSYATSYIPTSGSTVTRNQDIFTRDGIGSLINSEEGVLFVEMAALSDDGTYRALSLSDGTTSNVVRFYYNTISNNLTANVQSGGGASAIMNYTLTDITIFSKVALKYKLNNFSFWVNGFEVATDIVGTAPIGLNKLSLDDGSGGSDFYGKVKQLQVYTTALTDDQIRQLTQ